MFAHCVKVHVVPNQPLVISLPPDLPEMEAEVIVLSPDAPASKPTFATLEEFDAWLKRQPPSPYLGRGNRAPHRRGAGGLGGMRVSQVSPYWPSSTPSLPCLWCAIFPSTWPSSISLPNCAQYRIKTPDALHLAAAIHSGCNEFWTNDDCLAKAAEGRIQVIVFDQTS